MAKDGRDDDDGDGPHTARVDQKSSGFAARPKERPRTTPGIPERAGFRY